MQAQTFGHLLADGEHGVQRGHRLLEDHADLIAANLAHQIAAAGREINLAFFTALKKQATACNFTAAILNQSHQRQGGHRFARS